MLEGARSLEHKRRPPAPLRWMRFVFGRCINSVAEVRLPLAADMCSQDFLNGRQRLNSPIGCNTLAYQPMHQTDHGRRAPHLASTSSRERWIALMTAAIRPSRKAQSKSVLESSTAVNSGCDPAVC